MSTPAEMKASAAGSLAKTPVAHLLVYTATKRLTGSLELTTSDGERATVTFRGGAVKKVRTSSAIAYLGQLLYELGYIDEAALNASLNVLAARRCHQGRALLGARALTETQLAEGLREQILRKIAHLFSFGDDTTYAFYANVDHLADYGPDDGSLVDPFVALWRGVRDYYDEPRTRAILARIGPHRLRLATTASYERLELQAEELRAVESLRREPCSLGELAGMLGALHAAQLVYCLMLTRQLELISAEPIEPASSARPSAAPLSRTMPTARPSAPPPISFSPPPWPSARPPSGAPPRTSYVASIPPSGRVAVARSSAPPEPSGYSHEAERRKAIRERAQAITSEDYYRRLSLARDASAEDARCAFSALWRLWDPSALPPDLGDVFDDCARVRAAIVEAHATLTDPLKAAAYVERLRSEAMPSRSALLGDLAASGASSPYEAARICFGRNDLARAERLCRRAHDEEPNRAGPLALLAWLEAQRPENQGADATKARIAMLDLAVQLNESRADAFYWRAQLHKRLEDHASAIRDLQRAVARDPKHMDAMRDLRLYEMRVRNKSIRVPTRRKTPLPKAGGKGRG